MSTGDVDIDIADRDKLLSLIDYVPAAIIRPSGEIQAHKSGIYLQDIPIDPVTNLAALDHEHAERLGYFKIDLLNVSVYDGIRDENHLVELMCKPPPWQLLDDSAFVEEWQLWQISRHADLVAAMRPRSIEQLAMLLAIIRPAKWHLQHRSWDDVAKDVWVKPQDAKSAATFFKRPHAISYAMVLVVQINRIVERALQAEYVGA